MGAKDKVAATRELVWKFFGASGSGYQLSLGLSPSAAAAKGSRKERPYAAVVAINGVQVAQQDPFLLGAKQPAVWTLRIDQPDLPELVGQHLYLQVEEGAKLRLAGSARVGQRALAPPEFTSGEGTEPAKRLLWRVVHGSTSYIVTYTLSTLHSRARVAVNGYPVLEQSYKLWAQMNFKGAVYEAVVAEPGLGELHGARLTLDIVPQYTFLLAGELSIDGVAQAARPLYSQEEAPRVAPLLQPDALPLSVRQQLATGGSDVTVAAGFVPPESVIELQAQVRERGFTTIAELVAARRRPGALLTSSDIEPLLAEELAQERPPATGLTPSTSLDHLHHRQEQAVRASMNAHAAERQGADAQLAMAAFRWPAAGSQAGASSSSSSTPRARAAPGADILDRLSLQAAWQEAAAASSGFESPMAQLPAQERSKGGEVQTSLSAQLLMPGTPDAFPDARMSQQSNLTSMQSASQAGSIETGLSLGHSASGRLAGGAGPPGPASPSLPRHRAPPARCASGPLPTSAFNRLQIAEDEAVTSGPERSITAAGGNLGAGGSAGPAGLTANPLRLGSGDAGGLPVAPLPAGSSAGGPGWRGHAERGAGSPANQRQLLQSAEYSWFVKRDDITILRREDGSKWRLGCGSAGSVYKALMNGCDEVAVKLLREQEPTPAQLAVFHQEVMVLKSLRHRNIVQFYGACLDPHCWSIVTELMAGGDLYSALRTQPEALRWEALGRRIALDVALGLNYLHTRRPPLAHRDLKSPNVLLSMEGAAKIADVGLARAQAGGLMSAPAAFTPLWAAPELFRGEAGGLAGDMWAYGVVVWELISGIDITTMPALGLSRQVQGMAGSNKVLKLPPMCPPVVARIFYECTKLAPEERPTASKVVEWLRDDA